MKITRILAVCVFFGFFVTAFVPIPSMAVSNPHGTPQHSKGDIPSSVDDIEDYEDDGDDDHGDDYDMNYDEFDTGDDYWDENAEKDYPHHGDL
ncbi:hypothetical protein ElyMa_000957800 [Elysia marginata]|uniref:Secreted protein n=1 Tax=Elysia marginata TaxID=1093978 RepID=A0AAV4HDX5_9GAST|nr:hypothetical protein ElyMa_000957800 [Elysia marginata]